MKTSEEINKIAEALAKAQMEMETAVTNAKNPFFKSKYADYNTIKSVALPPLNKHGIAVSQIAENSDTHAVIHTMLMHSSGQFLCSTLAIKPTKNDAQGFGSALTYARRYGLSSMVCCGTEDDDGNNAVRRPTPVKQNNAMTAIQKRTIKDKWTARKESANYSLEEFGKYWDLSILSTQDASAFIQDFDTQFDLFMDSKREKAA